MPQTSPTVLRVLAVVAAACLIGGVVAIATGTGTSSSGSHAVASGGVGPTSTLAPGSGPGASAAPSSAPSSTLPGGKSTSKGTVPGQATTTAAPATTVAPLTTEPTSGDPGQPKAEAPGTYRYTYSSSSSSGNESGTISEKVTTQSSSGGVTRQSVDDTGGPQGSSGTSVVSWGPPGQSLLSKSFPIGNQSADCNFNPPVELLPGTLAVGTKWTIKSTCQTTFDGQPLTINLVGSATVTGKARVVVGGQPVDVWTISDSYDLNGSFGATSFKDHHVATDQVAARLGLLVEEDATDTVSSAQRSGTATSRRALQKLTPG